LIVEEAGGKSTNLQGKRTIYDGKFVSTNGKIHAEVLGLLT
jgi:fructose-1,6-bisphosphatase/inositol monophosphatase family enzyme